MNGNRQKRPWYVLVLGAMILVIVGFLDQLRQYDLLIPAVILLFLCMFGLLLRLAVIQWKKPDDEILKSCDLWHTGKLLSGKQVFLSTLFLIGVFLFRLLQNSDSLPTPAYILAAIVLILNLCSLILPRLKARRTDSPARTPRITGREITAFFVGLLPSLFICFFIGIGVYNGVWWFTLPPGLIFLLLFSRPLVAAVRSVARRHRETEERLPTSRKEADPWDRPDIDPAQYRKNRR